MNLLALAKGIIKKIYDPSASTRQQEWWGDPAKNPFITKTPTPSPIESKKTPNPTPTPASDIVETIKSFAKEYDMPIGDMADFIVKQQSKYPVFYDNPFATTVTSILESSGLKKFKENPENVYKPKQALGWGVRVPDEDYNPSTIKEVIKDYTSAIGGRNLEEEKKQYGDKIGAARYSSSQYYEPFRQSGNIEDLASAYEPNKQSYVDNTKQWTKMLNDKLAEIRAKKIKSSKK